MKQYQVVDRLTGGIVCHGHSAADTLAAVLDHAQTSWFLHWKQKPGATARTWHLVMTSPPGRTVDSYVPYVVDAEDANEAMTALGKMLIENRPPGRLDWLDGRYYCQPDGILPDGGCKPAELPPVVVAPDAAADCCAGFEEPVLDEIDPDCFPGPWTVTVVMADRAYGGREEGGWWFDTFDPFDQYARDRAIDHKIDRLFWGWADAVAYSLEVEDKCREWNAEERRRRKDSVASIGVYEAYVYSGYPVRIPAEKPMYE